jgi:hypothetical protein
MKFADFTETFSAAILLILMAILVLHLIKGDATTWLKSKFSAQEAT